MISDHTAKDRKGYYLNLKMMINEAEKYYKCNPNRLNQKTKDNLENAKKQYNEYKNFNGEYRRKYAEEWRKNNSGKEKERNRLWYKNNRKKAIACHEKWRRNNMEFNRNYQNQYQCDRRKTDLKFNLSGKMSRAIGKSLRRTGSIKSNKNGRHWETLMGYTLNDLIKRLQKTIPEGYTWIDTKNGKLHIDHIIPISAFNFTRPEHTDFKRCWSLENLRLLPAKENLIKNAKLDKSFQLALKI